MQSVHEKILLDKKKLYLLDEYKFWLTKKGYACTDIKRKKVKLHHLVLPKKEGFVIDHINRNKLDNRRCNLRYVTESQNKMNTLKQSNNTSGFRGVSWRKDTKKWSAYIKLNRKKISLGSFIDIEDAARAYKKAALKYFEQYMGEL